MESFALEAFNTGDFWAVEEEVVAEKVSKVLYPNDEPDAGKRLRLQQQYFFVSCSLPGHRAHPHRARRAAAVRPAAEVGDPTQRHPPLDRGGRVDAAAHRRPPPGWNEAWAITLETFAYTNHTLLPEALETWPLGLFGESLPRHLELIYEINDRFLDEVRTGSPATRTASRGCR